MTKPRGTSPVQPADDVVAVLGIGRWVLDAQRSSVSFASKTMWGMAIVRGVFTTVSGVGTLGEGGVIQGRLEIDSASLNTKNNTRDAHLRSAQFFNAEAHPQIMIDVPSTQLTGRNQLHVNAQLSVAGISKPLEFVATVVDLSADEVTLRTDVEIDKREFGMTANRLNMLKDPSTASVVATFTRVDATA